MNPMKDPFLKKTKSIKRYETAFERTIVSIITLIITVTMSMLWFSHGEKLVQGLVNSLEIRAKIMGKMKEVWEVLILSSALFLLKGIFRPSDRRKGSVQAQINYFLNLELAVFTVVELILITDIVYDEGYVGLLTRLVLNLLAMSYFVGLRVLQQLCEFLHFIWRHEFLYVGNVFEIRNGGKYQIIDIHLKGVGGLICKEESTGRIVNMPSNSFLRATLVLGNYTVEGRV
ncbi:cytochrome p450 [Corchorus olitorius]|uniref:Cytochrome p450 n=1 Tax=Corchorus olitorius TaxID=93759 RepID=A0A1R3J6C6_9ROSI|nr:cytochrome p450 [Corchorus olitorius]